MSPPDPGPSSRLARQAARIRARVDRVPGLILAAATWLVAFGGVLVVSSLAGRLVAESEQWLGVLMRVGSDPRRSERGSR